MKMEISELRKRIRHDFHEWKRWKYKVIIEYCEDGKISEEIRGIITDYKMEYIDKLKERIILHILLANKNKPIKFNFEIQFYAVVKSGSFPWDKNRALRIMWDGQNIGECKSYFTMKHEDRRGQEREFDSFTVDDIMNWYNKQYKDPTKE